MVNRDRLDLYDPNELSKDPATQVSYREAVTAQVASILLIEMREAAGLSREQLASLLGRSSDEMESLERGRSPDGPSMGLVLRVAELCGARLSVSFKNSTRPTHVIGGM
jgi:DNA-binding XRE family transcriptional regulator